jgi:hypothetical protein
MLWKMVFFDLFFDVLDLSYLFYLFYFFFLIKKSNKKNQGCRKYHGLEQPWAPALWADGLLRNFLNAIFLRPDHCNK